MRRTLPAAALISVTMALAAMTTTAAAASAATGSAPAGAPDTQVTATIKVGNTPLSLAVDAQTNRVYVLNNGAQTMSVINGKSNKVVATVPVADSGKIAVNPVTDRIYVLTGIGTVKVISGQTDKIVASVTGLNSVPKDGIAVNSATNTIYVTNQYVLKNGVVEDGTVSVISGRTNKAVATVPAGSVPEGIAADPRTNRVYVANAGSNLTPGTMSVINGQTDKVVATVPVGAFPKVVAVSQGADTIYVSGEDGLAVVSGQTNTVLTTVREGQGDVSGVSTDSMTSSFYTANSDANTVTVFDSQTNMAGAVVDVGNLPSAIATDTTTDTTYVANGNAGTVSVLTP
jgi:YVTN family beta-propeller protein